jgi:hypothetical protein
MSLQYANTLIYLTIPNNIAILANIISFAEANYPSESGAGNYFDISLPLLSVIRATIYFVS